MKFFRPSIYLFPLFLLFLVSCSSSKRRTPYWVNQVPTDSTSYMGIGMVLKEGNPDYANKAKEIALTELASSIQVNISVSSVLSQTEINKAFNESFSSTTKLNSNNFLYEIEKFDVWENKKKYWVFYKINKAEYEKIRKSKLAEVLSQAFLLYKEGLKNEVEKDLINSIMKFVQAFEIISPFLNEPLIVNESNEKQLYLGKELYAKLFSFYKEYEIQYLLPEVSASEPMGDFLKIKISYKKSPLSNFPVLLTSSGESTIAGKYNTDNNGELKIRIPSNERSAFGPVNITISADVVKLINEVIGDGIAKDILNTLSAKQETFPLSFSKCTNIDNENQKMDNWNFDKDTSKKDTWKIDEESQKKDTWNIEKEQIKFDDPWGDNVFEKSSYDSHEKLMGFLKKNSGIESKLITSLKNCKIDYSLTVPQVLEIIRLFKFDNSKWEAVEFLLAGITDKKTYKEALKSEFVFDDYKEKLDKL